MSLVEIMFIILSFITAYSIMQIVEIKKKLVRLVQENAVIWQFIKEHEYK